MSSKGAGKGKGKGGFGAVRGGQSFARSSPYTNAPPQAGKESAYCSLHGKKRSLECLKPEGTGYVCTQKHQCKQSEAGISGIITTAAPPIRKGGGGFGDQECKLCSAHNKWRLITSLETDGWGGFCCAAGSECKIGASTSGTPRRNPPAGLPAEGTGVCSIHNKPRSWSCLDEDGFGNYQCIPQHACKTKEADANSVSQIPSHLRGETGMCTIHNKKRSMVNLTQTMNGLQCAEGMECKVGARPQGEADEPIILENGLDPNETFICSAHQKQRSASVLIEDGEGGYMCRADEECKGKRVMESDPSKPVRAPPVRGSGGTHAVCSVHEKMRSVSCMEDDGIGGMSCTLEQQCKSKQE